MTRIKNSPTKVDLVFKIKSAKLPKNRTNTPIVRPKNVDRKITKRTKGNLINKLAAITFLLPLLPMRLKIFLSKSIVFAFLVKLEIKVMLS